MVRVLSLTNSIDLKAVTVFVPESSLYHAADQLAVEILQCWTLEEYHGQTYPDIYKLRRPMHPDYCISLRIK